MNCNKFNTGTESKIFPHMNCHMFLILVQKDMRTTISKKYSFTKIMLKTKNCILFCETQS